MMPDDILGRLGEEYRVSPTIPSYTRWDMYREYIEGALKGEIDVVYEDPGLPAQAPVAGAASMPRDGLAAAHIYLFNEKLGEKMRAAVLDGGVHRVVLDKGCGGKCISLSSLGLDVRGKVSLEYLVVGKPDTYRSHMGLIRIRNGAELNMIIRLLDSDRAPSMLLITVDVERGASARIGYVARPGLMTRLALLIRMSGEGGNVFVRGAALARKGHMDNIVDIIVDSPRSYSYMLFTGLQDGEAEVAQRGVGRITRRGRGSGIEYYSESLMLSSRARFYAQPRLEIMSGKIKAARHAARNTHVLPEQVFYLETRGIPAAEAESMIIQGFLMRRMWTEMRRAVKEAYMAFIRE